jgi:hypothetical protein
MPSSEEFFYFEAGTPTHEVSCLWDTFLIHVFDIYLIMHVHNRQKLMRHILILLYSTIMFGDYQHDIFHHKPTRLIRTRILASHEPSP